MRLRVRGSMTGKLILLIALGMFLVTTSVVLISRKAFERASSDTSLLVSEMLGKDIEEKNLKDANALDDFGKTIAGYMALISVQPMWDCNFDILETYVSEVRNIPNVLSATILDAQGKVLAGEKKDSMSGGKLFEIPVQKDEEKLGTVRLWIDTEHLSAARYANESVRDNLLLSFSVSSEKSSTEFLGQVLLYSVISGVLSLLFILAVLCCVVSTTLTDSTTAIALTFDCLAIFP